MTKIDELISILQKNNIDFAIFFRPQELMMFLGYFPHWNGSIFSVDKYGKKYLFVCDYEPDLKFGKQLDDLEIIVYKWASATKDPFEELLVLIQDKFKQAKKFTFNSSLIQAAPSSNYGEGSIIPLSFILNITKKFSFINVDSQLSYLHLVKDAFDIKQLNRLHEIASVGIDEFFKAQIGQSDLSLSLTIEKAILQKADMYKVDTAKVYALVQSGNETLNSYRYNKTQSNVIQKEDTIFLELSVCVDGYWLDLTRVHVIKPSTLQIKCFNYVKEALNEALSNVRAGVLGNELYKSAVLAFKKNGVEQFFYHGLGHATGYGYHDPGISLNNNCDVVLKENMVLTIEPGLYDVSFNGGMRIEENILVTNKGFECFSKRQNSL